MGWRTIRFRFEVGVLTLGLCWGGFVDRYEFARAWVLWCVFGCWLVVGL